MNEPLFRKTLLAIALTGLVAGFLGEAQAVVGIPSDTIRVLATVPVALSLARSIVLDLLAGRVGVDAIALISMSAAIVLDQTLAGLVIAIMYVGGTVIEDFARGKAERDLRALTDRSPRIAHRLSAVGLQRIPVDDVRIEDRLLVRAGELVPVDGVLLERSARIDESAVTGEPLAKRCQTGEPLRSGTVNAGEPFHMRATAIARESTYAGIVRMVEAAQTAKAPYVRMADRFAIVMLPLTLAVAAIAWLLSGDPIRALSVLVVATPCPLILAAPIAFVAGISQAARRGILVKGSAALEALAKARTAIFDKTGTLTHGGAELIEATAAPGRDSDELFRLLASLEQASHHVLAEAIVATARRRGLVLGHPTDVREFRGSGLRGRVCGQELCAGSKSLVLSDRDVPSWAEGVLARYRQQPVLTVFVEVDGRLAGIFVFGDGLRGDAVETVSSLRKAGVDRLLMLTGDDAETAERVGTTLGLDEVLADAAPADKVAIVRRENEKSTTIMVGDGINDAPALATATVGIAMGARGATASSAAADVIVLADRLRPVAAAVEIAQRTRAIASQSVIVGLVLSGAAMVAAAAGFITPVAGALLQEAIDVAVIVNALRALGPGQPPRWSSDVPGSEGAAAQPARRRRSDHAVAGFAKSPSQDSRKTSTRR